ncbi:hypothetical protein [uncultured Draconibacterium sp.]|uniref:hypothetical protein n=1 Tax=uncultured Draconibacterium sp. TaxID=1573823 RepID=UPI0029C78013|nr:hypothetical protein [uncultured Draconibacterium sp.]
MNANRRYEQVTYRGFQPADWQVGVRNEVVTYTLFCKKSYRNSPETSGAGS